MLSFSRSIAAAAAAAVGGGGGGGTRAMSALANFKAVNEPCLGFLPGSKERNDLEGALQVTLTDGYVDGEILVVDTHRPNYIGLRTD